MPKENDSKPDSGVAQAAEHVAGAYKLLKALQEKIDEHPEIGQAVNKLETALAILKFRRAECCNGMLYLFVGEMTMIFVAANVE